MNKFIENLLADLTRKIIKKYDPIIIGITGSVGKTSGRDAIYAVVSTKYKTNKPTKNFNNALGLPFSVIGISDYPGRSVMAWLKIFSRAFHLTWFTQPFPEVLVLEMGIDRVGDMDHLVSMAKPDISVITNIGMSHIEFFNGVEQIAEEKGKIIEALSEDGVAILNADSDVVLAQRHRTKGKVVTYATEKSADVSVKVVGESLQIPASTQLHVTAKGTSYEVQVAGIGKAHVGAAAAGIAVGEMMHIERELIQKGVASYKPAQSRLGIIAGIKKSIIIDDTYNASPDSTKEALQVLYRMPHQYKIVALGDMRELGDYTEDAHKEIGKIVAGMHVNYFITVGAAAKFMAESAVQYGMPADSVLSFETSDEAKQKVLSLVEPESAILVKGSQKPRMEKITKELMAEPMRAPELVCRQTGAWLNS